MTSRLRLFWNKRFELPFVSFYLSYTSSTLRQHPYTGYNIPLLDMHSMAHSRLGPDAKTASTLGPRQLECADERYPIILAAVQRK